ncbi:hypothetical protein V496_01479 [Pseudogymnoascus sp. VKM F-4515 (FW-2607)]|nr:hypothetical protein V496_01479 [Pseudogymnoascus sp. VKM F-4515 (FW-2607)]
MILKFLKRCWKAIHNPKEIDTDSDSDETVVEDCNSRSRVPLYVAGRHPPLFQPQQDVPSKSFTKCVPPIPFATIVPLKGKDVGHIYLGGDVIIEAGLGDTRLRNNVTIKAELGAHAISGKYLTGPIHIAAVNKLSAMRHLTSERTESPRGTCFKLPKENLEKIIQGTSESLKLSLEHYAKLPTMESICLKHEIEAILHHGKYVSYSEDGKTHEGLFYFEGGSFSIQDKEGQYTGFTYNVTDFASNKYSLKRIEKKSALV